MSLCQLCIRGRTDARVSFAGMRVRGISPPKEAPDKLRWARSRFQTRSRDRIVKKFEKDARPFFDSVYRDVPPWEVGGPQPALVELFNDYPPVGPVLDVGCGSGDLAIALAKRGLEVLGVDFVEAPVRQARGKAAALPLEIEQWLDFEVADASRPALLGRRFATVVDSGFMHVLDVEQTSRFVDDLAETLLPGGRYYLLAFATEFDLPNTPRRITEEELRRRFTHEEGWRILALRGAEFRNRIAPVQAISMCAERAPSADE
jgi:SAM-dependent methyltransferase